MPTGPPGLELVAIGTDLARSRLRNLSSLLALITLTCGRIPVHLPT